MNLLRKSINKMSIKNKFIIPTSLLILVSIFAISWYLISSQEESYRRELETSGNTMITILANNAESGVIFESKFELDEILNQLTKFEAVKYAYIQNKDGEILSDIGTEINDYKILYGIGHKHDNGERHNKDKVHDSLDNHYIKDTNGNQYICLRKKILTLKQELGIENLGITDDTDKDLNSNAKTEQIGTITLILTIEQVNKAIEKARIAAILVAVVVLILAILMLTFFIKIITTPLKQLVDITDQVSRGDLSKKVTLNQRDEIGHLAIIFNKMIDSLKQSRDEIEEYNRNLEQKIVERTLELEEIQKHLVQSEKLSAIGQLAAGVAHELNNPLGGILGYAQFTLEKLQKNIKENDAPKNATKYVKYMQDIETQARRCKTIVQNLLRFSRTSRTTDFTDINANQVIEDTLTFMEHQLHMNQIDLKVKLDENIPLIQGDSSQLQQVLTNLVINAMHASPEDSKIEVLSRFSPPLGEFSGAVEIIITDEGCGISQENIKKIFEPFYTTKQVGKGTGLGLSVSYGIIKDHGGEIKVESTLGEGSIFIVVLPIQESRIGTDKITNDKIVN
ncbi:MAG: ATP-binding protein [candidate division Zixibacteria bacterium]|nr:ATP-binding protein [candidate division Zixibacteria bacterium]